MANIKIKNLSTIVYKDEPNLNGTIGIKDNKIIEILNFFSEDQCKNIIAYIENKKDGWGHVAFYGYRLGYFPDLDDSLLNFKLPKNFYVSVVKNIKKSVKKYFLRDVSLNTIHVQKLGIGAFGHPHSDNTNEDGSPSHFEINKYAAIAYLNDDYSGGELLFPDHNLQIKPRVGSLLIFPGGIENIHGVNEILSGDRYCMVSFWDFSSSQYSEDEENLRKEKMQDWSDSWFERWKQDWSYRWKTWNFM